MSSTLRNVQRNVSIDYYRTEESAIELFFNNLPLCFWNNLSVLDYILDPCAGGDKEHEMPYPSVLKKFGYKLIDTIDIRHDSKADVVGDYLKINVTTQYKLIITNPPFNIALNIIKKALKDVANGGYVIMLQRLNFLGSKKRREFFNSFMPQYIYVHSKRIKFSDFGSGDSIEYAHFVWQKNFYPEFAQIKVI